MNEQAQIYRKQQQLAQQIHRQQRGGQRDVSARKPREHEIPVGARHHQQHDQRDLQSMLTNLTHFQSF